MHDFNVTRSFNDDNQVIYMHLGRGVPKARGAYKDKGKSSSEQWIDYLRGNLFSEPQLQFVDEQSISEFDFLKFSVNEFYYLNVIKNVLSLFEDGAKLISFEGLEALLEDYDNIIRFTGLEKFRDKDCDCIIAPAIRDINILKGTIVKFTESLKSGGILLVPDLIKPGSHPAEDLWGLGYREVRVKKNGSPEILRLVKKIEAIKKDENINNAGVVERLINRKFRILIRKDNNSSIKNPFKNDNPTIGYILIAVK